MTNIDTEKTEHYQNQKVVNQKNARNRVDDIAQYFCRYSCTFSGTFLSFLRTINVFNIIKFGL